MKILNEFKEFAVRGNVLDMAVGIVIGGAFGKIVSSLVSDVIMPPIGVLLNKVNFSELYIDLSGPHRASLAEAQKAGDATLNYGLFINNILDFLIVAFFIFLVIKQVNLLRGPKGPDKKDCPFCATSIPIKAVRCPQCTSDLTAQTA
jgi:large conductance mechanosensitive channel